MAFYVGQLGFEVKCDEVVNGERFLVVSSVNLVNFAPECSLRFRSPTTERDHQILSMGPPTGLMLTVETDDFDQVIGKLASFGTAMNMRTNKKEGYRAVTLMDPMGNQVILVSKITNQIGRVFVKDVGH